MVIPLHHTLQIVFIVLAGALLAAMMMHRSARHSPGHRATLGAFVVLAGLSVAGYTRFGSFHPYGRTHGDHVYHYPDLYHYYFGAKYFRELGYFRIYEATAIAFRELREEGSPAPVIPVVRDLVGQEQLISTEQVLRERGAQLKARFSDARWRSFKSDLATLLGLPFDPYGWHQMLGDMGFNPPPTWNVTASSLANLIPFTALSAELMGFIDLVLVFGLAGWFVWRAFGSLALCGYLVALGNNWIASHDWTGGSFMRQVWLALLVAGVSCVKLEWYIAAGALLAASAADRIWPGFFLVGALVALQWARRRGRGSALPLRRMLLGAVPVLAGLVALSLIMFPPHFWTDFLQKLWKHNSTYFAMHIGFQKLAVFSAAGHGPPAWSGDGYLRWEQLLSDYYRQHVVGFSAVKLLFAASALALCLRSSPQVAALVLGSTLLYFTSMPANYYYSYLALFVPVFLVEGGIRPSDALRVVGLFALLLGFALAPLRWQNIIVHNGHINLFILLYLAVVHLTLLSDLYGRDLAAWVVRMGEARCGWRMGRP
ncbi:MAG: hypothetical protein JW940_23555 [Polyangiaceae bacterium]|nr:hypothetical protein [Polyangiaceae bacterium]